MRNPRRDDMTNPRISARVSRETRDLVHTAADIIGVSVADFLAASAIEEAHRVIERERTVFVSDKYADAFFAALETPPEPNAALLDAVKDHRSN
jgi:uncharacterized protein (DUF1778 family)